MKNKHLLGIIVAAAAVAVIGAALFAVRPGQKPPDAAPPAEKPANLPPLGSDRDEHGCIGSAGYSWCPLTEKCQRPWEQKCSVEAVFKCAKKKSIVAEFDAAPVDQVALKLSDGREMTLPRAVSGSGARYADAAEKTVFWNKGDTAFLTEDGQETYSGCAAKS